MKSQFRGLTLTAVAVLLGITAMPAHATLSVIVNPTTLGPVVSGGTLFQDGVGGVNPDACIGTVGTLCFTFSNVNFTIGSISSTGSPVASLSITAGGEPLTTSSPLLTLAISDIGFTTPPVPLSLAQDVTGETAATGGATGSVSAQGYFSSTNTLFSTSGTTTGSTGLTPLGGASVMASSGTIVSGSPYALTSLVFLNVTALATGTNKNVQVNANLDAVAQVVPEPMSVSLLGGVLLCTFGAIRRKTRKA